MAIRLVQIGGDTWRESAGPWLRGVEAWREERPTVVLTPDRAQGFYLRSRLVEAGRSFFGIRFWTPSDARRFLQGAVCPQLHAATQDEQALLARACAEKLLREEPGEEEATLRSVTQDPEPFRRAYDGLVGAGWRPSRDGAPYGRRLAAEFEATLRQAGLTTQAGLHRTLREAEVPAIRPIARVLVLGFNSTHWPIWDLLQAVCRMADDAEVALEHPCELARGLDELWTGSWESFAGSPYEPGSVESVTPGPLECLARSFEAGEPEPCGETEIHFLATADLSAQVRAVTLQALEYLRRPDCTRLGIVFPRGDALALGVADQLRALAVPMNDSIGATLPGPCESRWWQVWLDLQEESTARRLIDWLRACEADGRETGLASLTASTAADRLDRAIGERMADNLDFLAGYLDPRKTEQRALAEFLRRRRVLPEEGTTAGFLVATRDALERLKADDVLTYLPETVPAGSDQLKISRRTFLAWLREAADSRSRVRPEGNYFYGKVHLLTYSQLAGQEWTHLVLTGLNEGVWPRLIEAGAFGSHHELTELNKRARALNRRSARQGEQGEGHEIVAPGHGHILLPTESHDLALRDLCATLRLTRGAVCLAARTLDQGRNLLPSDFFSHAWQMKTGQVLDDAMFRDLAERTRERCEEHAVFFPTDSGDSQEIGATKLAYKARHDPAMPFGRYEFAFTKPPAAPVQLSCKAWESALAHPATAWLSHVIGVEPWPQGGLSWKLSLGTWTHQWLSSALASTTGELDARVRAAAERDLHAVEKRAREAGIELHPWWRQMWNQTLAVTRGLARGLEAELAGRVARAEFQLPKSLELALPTSSRADFRVSGRLDLLLLEGEPVESVDGLKFAGCRAWVVDFKTGGASELSEKRLQKGQGLQIALYGLGLRALGADDVQMSVLTPGTTLKEQLAVAKLDAMTEPFRAIDTIHRTGVFGQSPAEDREHGFAPDWPLTTRAISQEVLKAKWAIERGGEGA